MTRKFTPRERRLDRENHQLGETIASLRNDRREFEARLSEAEKIRQKLAVRYNRRGTQVLAAAAIIRMFSGKPFRNEAGEEICVPLRLVADLINAG